ncbi:hypothetical protein GBAR_LOCUS11223, partial [Geodia barretti]
MQKSSSQLGRRTTTVLSLRFVPSSLHLCCASASQHQTWSLEILCKRKRISVRSSKEESEKLINGEGGIKASVRPKVGFGEGIRVTGEVLAELAETYINALNEKGSVPSLEGAWGAVIELKLAEEVEKSVGLYVEEMTAKVEGSLPMEHSIPEEDSDKPTLIGCHWVVFDAKRDKLSEKMRQIIPQPGPDDPPVEQGDLYKSMMKRFKDAIVEEGEGGMDTME